MATAALCILSCQASTKQSGIGTVFSTDYFQYIQEFLVIAIMLVALCLCIRYREEVTVLLTGDTVLHMSCGDVMWFTCGKCCGLCNGEWSRLCSKFCCPCNKRLQNRNLVREFGRFMGVASHSVELKNMVVGDLPFDSARGDFYLSIECSNNPPMVTALQEERLPKCIHFPETITLRIKDMWLEPRVKITVKELNIVGSQPICECYLSVSSVLDWTDDAHNVKRIQMRPINNDVERATPPWILLEFSEGEDIREISSTPNADAYGPIVRTWLPKNADPQKSLAYALEKDTGDFNRLLRKGGHAGWDGSADPRWGPHQEREVVEVDVTKFKTGFLLLDDVGNPVTEPNEADLFHIHFMRGSFKWLIRLCWIGMFFSLAGVLFFRGYFGSCYMQYHDITIAIEKGLEPPIPISTLNQIDKVCKDKWMGRSDYDEHIGKVSCLPSGEQVANVCALQGNRDAQRNMFNETLKDFPKHYAFVRMIHKWTGFTPKKTWFECQAWTCDFRNKWVHFQFGPIRSADSFIVALVPFWLITICFCRCCANQCIRSSKKHMARQTKHKGHERTGGLE